MAKVPEAVLLLAGLILLFQPVIRGLATKVRVIYYLFASLSKILFQLRTSTPYKQLLLLLSVVQHQYSIYDIDST